MATPALPWSWKELPSPLGHWPGQLRDSLSLRVSQGCRSPGSSCRRAGTSRGCGQKAGGPVSWRQTTPTLQQGEKQGSLHPVPALKTVPRGTPSWPASTLGGQQRPPPAHGRAVRRKIKRVGWKKGGADVLSPPCWRCVCLRYSIYLPMGKQE